MQTFNLSIPVAFECGDLGGVSEVTAVHSGNIGDVIYSLPTCKALGVNHLYLNVFVDTSNPGRALTKSNAVHLAKLLLNQCGLKKITVIDSNLPLESANTAAWGLKYNLDVFRSLSSRLGLHLVYMHSLPFGLSVDASERWLDFKEEAAPFLPPTGLSERFIAINLTARYRKLDLEFYKRLLSGVPASNILWLGIEQDHAERAGLQGVSLKTKDFIQIAKSLEACSLFIGNPSFVNALAEGMKVNRFVEVPSLSVHPVNAYPLDVTGFALELCNINAARRAMAEVLDVELPSLPTSLIDVNNVGLKLSAKLLIRAVLRKFIRPLLNLILNKN